MSDHLSDEALTAYRAGTASPRELLEVDDHLAGCAACRERLAGAPAAAALSALRQVIRPPEPSEHLSFETLAAYVDGELGAVDREIAAGHLAVCAACEAELVDLRAFRALVSTYPAAEHAPAPRRSAWGAFVALLAHPLIRIPVPAATGALAAAALVFHLGVRPARDEVAALQTAREGLARVSSRVPGLERENDRLRGSLDRTAAEQARLREQLERLRRAPRPSPAPPPPAPKAAPVLALRDGAGSLATDAEGNLVRLERLPRVVSEAVRAQQLPRPVEMAAVVGLTGYVRGAPTEAFAVKAPAGVVIETDRPTFRWSAHPEATGYRVTVLDAALRPAAESELLAGTEWTPPRSLPRGGVYQWEVVAYRGEQDLGKAPRPPAPDAKFRVLAAAQVEELRRARVSLAGSHLALGVLYTRAGLLADAERELLALARTNPKSALARRLLGQVRALRAAGATPSAGN
jgi:anti-sigma factor ChrR (cupin superfamily)